MDFSLTPSTSLSEQRESKKSFVLYAFILDTGLGRVQERPLPELIRLYLEIHHSTGERILVFAPRLDAELQSHPLSAEETAKALYTGFYGNLDVRDYVTNFIASQVQVSVEFAKQFNVLHKLPCLVFRSGLSEHEDQEVLELDGYSAPEVADIFRAISHELDNQCQRCTEYISIERELRALETTAAEKLGDLERIHLSGYDKSRLEEVKAEIEAKLHRTKEKHGERYLGRDKQTWFRLDTTVRQNELSLQIQSIEEKFARSKEADKKIREIQADTDREFRVLRERLTQAQPDGLAVVRRIWRPPSIRRLAGKAFTFAKEALPFANLLN